MVFKVTILIACFVAAAAAQPVDNDAEGQRTYLNSEHSISGASGTFRYPLSGHAYTNNERVLITASFPENTVFILKNYTTERVDDKINFHKWVGDDLVLDKTYSGISTDATYFLPEGNFLITFHSDEIINTDCPHGICESWSGFNFQWAPLETLLLH